MMAKKLIFLLVGTLRRQLVVGMVLIVASMMSLFALDQMRRQQAVEMGRQSEQAVALVRGVAASSAVWVASRDYSGLQEIVKGISRYPNLRHIIVLDLKGQVLAHNDPTKIGLYLTDLPPEAKLITLRTASLLDVVNPVMLAGHQVGWVRVGLSQDSLQAEIALVQRKGILYALIAIALSVLLAVLAGRYLTRRLYAIQQVADAVQAGTSGVRVLVSGGDEAAQLARQFNRMLDSLAQQEEAAAALIYRNRVMMDNALEGIHIMDDQGNLIEANDAFCGMLGYTQEEIQRLNVADWEAKMTHDELKASIKQLLESHAVFETLHRRKDRSVIDVEVSVVGVELDGRKCLYASSRDITGKKRAQADLISRSAALERANADLTRFADVSAHHLMEPTRRLTSYAQQLRVRVSALSGVCYDEEVCASLDYIEHDAARLRTMVRDVQLYLAAGTPRGEVKMEDANAVVSALQQRFAPQLAAQHVTLDIGVLPTAMLDRPRLTDLFTVLLDNALHHGQSADPNVVSIIRITGEREE
ncbi:MAG: PAS domain S-box protein, partial [Gallionellaceae bacterium]|nr:PAS domain S-box protein [Gallionellaceae bacterium]